MTSPIKPGPIKPGFGRANASRWRRATMCIVDSGSPAPARLDAIDGRGATICTNAALDPGASVTLSHPRAGEIAAKVRDCDAQQIRLDFASDARGVGFAMAAIAADLLPQGA